MFTVFHIIFTQLASTTNFSPSQLTVNYNREEYRNSPNVYKNSWDYFIFNGAVGACLPPAVASYIVRGTYFLYGSASRNLKSVCCAKFYAKREVTLVHNDYNIHLYRIRQLPEDLLRHCLWRSYTRLCIVFCHKYSSRGYQMAEEQENLGI